METMEETIQETSEFNQEKQLEEFFSDEIIESKEIDSVDEIEDEVIQEDSEPGVELKKEKVDDKALDSIESVGVDSEVKSSEVELLKEQNKLLFERLEKITERLAVVPERVVKEEKPEIKEFDLIGDLDIDEVVSNKELFNKVISRAIDLAEQRISEKLASSIPQTVSAHTNQALTIKDYTDAFYHENSDLIPVKKTVGIIAREIYSENPNLSLQNLYTEAAKKTREVLGITRLPITNKREGEKRERRPEFPSGSKGTQRKQMAGNIDRVQQDINDTLGL